MDPALPVHWWALQAAPLLLEIIAFTDMALAYVDWSQQEFGIAAALSGDKKVVVCTIQTFPFALKAVRELAALRV